MSKEKQIEEMACAMCGNNKICVGEGVERCIIYPEKWRNANKLYNAGYRKSQEVAREIFEEINDLRDRYAMGDIEYPDFQFELGKIEKKYTEEEK